MNRNPGEPRAYFAEFSSALDRLEVTAREPTLLSLDEGLGLVIDLIISLKRQGGKAILIGNGGSAAIVSHVHNDLCKAVGVRAMALDDTPLLTALANDEGYHEVFKRPMELWAEPGDVMIAVSSSGESENIVSAAVRARQKGCRLVTFTGFKADNRLRQLGDLNVYVPSSHYGYVEMAHSVIAHFVTDTAVMRLAAPD